MIDCVCFACQDAACVFQVNVCVSPASRARPAPVPSQAKPACRMTDRCVAVWESVCVAGVCVMTLSAPERSVRSVSPATTPVCLTGNLSLIHKDSYVLTIYIQIFSLYYFSKKKRHTIIANDISFNTVSLLQILSLRQGLRELSSI